MRAILAVAGHRLVNCVDEDVAEAAMDAGGGVLSVG